MSSDLRYQLAALIRETPDRVRATFRPDWNPVYDTADGRADCERCRHRDYTPPSPPVPVQGTGSDGRNAGGGADQAPPPPALHRYIPWARSRRALLCRCDQRFGGCGAAIGAPCVTADGRITPRPHKVRIEAAARATVVSDP